MTEFQRSSVTTWLNGIENQDPLHTSQCRKRKAEGLARSSPQKRVAGRSGGTRGIGNNMPASKGRGRGRVEERVPLNDTTPNNLRLPRRSSRHTSGHDSSREEPSIGPLQNAPELAYTSSRHSATTSTRSRSSSPRKVDEVRAVEVMPKVDKIRKVLLSNDERDFRPESKKGHQAAADVGQTLQQASVAVDAMILHVRI